jgi:8-oxo-dGTP diphosphatase
MTELERRQRVAAYAICIDDGRILLCRLSARATEAGQWTLPGGGIDFGEHPADGVIRELQEETGLTGEIQRLLAVDSFLITREDDRGPYEHHGLRILYEVTVTGGTLQDELDESTDKADWFTEDEARALPLVGLARRALDVAFRAAADAPPHRLR